jgi:hypothetical protein
MVSIQGGQAASQRAADIQERVARQLSLARQQIADQEALSKAMHALGAVKATAADEEAALAALTASCGEARERRRLAQHGLDVVRHEFAELQNAIRLKKMYDEVMLQELEQQRNAYLEGAANGVGLQVGDGKDDQAVLVDVEEAVKAKVSTRTCITSARCVYACVCVGVWVCACACPRRHDGALLCCVTGLNKTASHTLPPFLTHQIALQFEKLLENVEAQCSASIVEEENMQRALAKKECKVVLLKVKEQFDKSVRPFLASLEAVHRQQLCRLGALQQQHDVLVEEIRRQRLAAAMVGLEGLSSQVATGTNPAAAVQVSSRIRCFLLCARAQSGFHALRCRHLWVSLQDDQGAGPAPASSVVDALRLRALMESSPLAPRAVSFRPPALDLGGDDPATETLRALKVIAAPLGVSPAALPSLVSRPVCRLLTLSPHCFAKPTCPGPCASAVGSHLRFPLRGCCGVSVGGALPWCTKC